jgi:hypothetical protein
LNGGGLVSGIVVVVGGGGSSDIHNDDIVICIVMLNFRRSISGSYHPGLVHGMKIHDEKNSVDEEGEKKERFVVENTARCTITRRTNKSSPKAWVFLPLLAKQEYEW